ncbi:hypothetical protein C9374_002940 [Naegleria lovaniensis]|uniref:PUM-HD domain-containing protein n=1 Tax=Naegleria lovaniensis TaxID=51637 RepID=A0AA88GU10_NAELO|nr:uncharacterized protein C9374_002940 [Naegleria lovaniensis]KAG2385791.1 hypothetical protein C9374_002940 [Naegleria lovaniensis]
MKQLSSTFNYGRAAVEGAMSGFNKCPAQQYSLRCSSDHKILLKSLHVSSLTMRRSSSMLLLLSHHTTFLNVHNFGKQVCSGFSSSSSLSTEKCFSMSMNKQLTTMASSKTNNSNIKKPSTTTSATTTPNSNSKKERKVQTLSKQDHQQKKSTTNEMNEQYKSVLFSTLFSVDNKLQKETLLSETKDFLLNKMDDQEAIATISKRLDIFSKEDIKDIIHFLDEQNLLIPATKKQLAHTMLTKIFNCAGPEEKSFLIDKCLFSQNFIEMCSGRFSGATVNSFIPGFNLLEMKKLLNLLQGNTIVELTKSAGGTFILETLVNNLHDPSLKQEYFKLIEPLYATLTTDQNGNYLVQNCINHMNADERIRFIDLLSQDFKYLCQTSEGCIVARHLLKTSTTSVVRHFFTTILLPDIKIFACDKFSNFIIEENFSKIYHIERRQVLEGISTHLVEISSTTHGSMFLKQLFQMIERSEELMILSSAVKNNILELSKNATSFFVVDEWFKRVLKVTNLRKELSNAVTSHVLSMIQHAHGSVIVQNVFKSESVDRSELEGMVYILLNHFDRILKDPKSSAVLKAVVEKGFAEVIFLKMKGKHLSLLKTCMHHL